MKARVRLIFTGILLSLLSLLTTSLATSASSGRVSSKELSGNVKEVAAADKTISVKGFWGARLFHLGDDCEVVVNGKAAEPGNLRPGQRVHVCYEDANGVLIARKVIQENRVYRGTIKTIDLNARELAVEHLRTPKRFELSPDCRVVLRDETAGSLQDLKPGHPVEVIYEEPGGSWVAHEIDQRSASYSGTITAMDATTRSLKIERGLRERRFSLGNGSVISVHGKVNGTLADLRLGERVTLSYDDIDGVAVVNRVAAESSSKEPALSAGANR